MIIILDEEGNVCKVPAETTINAQVILHSKPPIYADIITAQVLKSVCWFKGFKFHITGKVTVKFTTSLYPDIKPLEAEINVIGLFIHSFIN